MIQRARTQISYWVLAAVLMTLCLHLPLDAYVVVANQSVSGETLSAADLRKIYLGKKKFWQGDNSIAPAKLRKGSADESFLREVVQKTPSQFRIYWKRAVFTGKRVPYQVFESEQELLEYVATTEGAVGYVDQLESAQLPEGLKVVQLQ